MSRFYITSGFDFEIKKVCIGIFFSSWYYKSFYAHTVLMLLIKIRTPSIGYKVTCSCCMHGDRYWIIHNFMKEKSTHWISLYRPSKYWGLWEGGGMAVKKNLIDIEYYLFWYITYLVGDDTGDKQLKIRQACKSQS